MFNARKTIVQCACGALVLVGAAEAREILHHQPEPGITIGSVHTPGLPPHSHEKSPSNPDDSSRGISAGIAGVSASAVAPVSSVTIDPLRLHRPFNRG
jgi:hypothetical protein